MIDPEMDSSRTEQVARAVADALGDKFSSFANPPGWPTSDFFIEVAGPDGEEVPVSPEEYTSDLNVAGRLFCFATEQVEKLDKEWKVSTRDNRDGISSKKLRIIGFLLHEFQVQAFNDTPAAIEALCVTAGLVDPEETP